MNPKIGVLFKSITDSDIKDIEVEKISMSKSRRKLKLTLPKGTSDFAAGKSGRR